MFKTLRALKSNKKGASAAEYALILAVLGAVIVAGLSQLGGGIRNAFGKTTNTLNNGS